MLRSSSTEEEAPGQGRGIQSATRVNVPELSPESSAQRNPSRQLQFGVKSKRDKMTLGLEGLKRCLEEVGSSCRRKEMHGSKTVPFSFFPLWRVSCWNSGGLVAMSLGNRLEGVQLGWTNPEVVAHISNSYLEREGAPLSGSVFTQEAGFHVGAINHSGNFPFWT